MFSQKFPKLFFEKTEFLEYDTERVCKEYWCESMSSLEMHLL